MPKIPDSFDQHYRNIINEGIKDGQADIAESKAERNKVTKEGLKSIPVDQGLAYNIRDAMKTAGREITQDQALRLSQILKTAEDPKDKEEKDRIIKLLGVYKIAKKIAKGDDTKVALAQLFAKRISDFLE